MLYGPNGSVVARSSKDLAPRADRNDETEATIRSQLKSIDSLLDIRYVEWAGRYSLVCQWPQSDKRWELYQTGAVGEPFDSLGWFCEDMQDPSSLPVAPDSIEQLVLARLQSCDNTLYPWKDRMKEIIDKNAKVRKNRQQEVIDQTGDIAGTLYHATTHMKTNQFEKLLEEVSGGKH